MASTSLFMLVPVSLVQKAAPRLRSISSRVVALYPGLNYDLVNAQMDISAEAYAVGSFLSGLVWGSFAAFLLFAAARLKAMPLPLMLLLPILGMVLGGLVFMLINLYYPRIIAKSVASAIDRWLVFAIRDMLIQVSSGIPLFNVIVNVAEGDYGQVSVEFMRAARAARSGTSLIDALEDMAIRNQSVYLKKTCWQIVTAMRAGANLTTALKSILKLLIDYQRSLIKAYNAQLNFIVLIYLLVAAVLPTVGTTVLVIFSVFGVLGVTPEVYMAIVGGGLVLQTAVIAFVYMSRPRLYE